MQTRMPPTHITYITMFLLPTLLKTAKCIHTHISMPVLKKQLKALVSVSISGEGLGRNLFSVWTTTSFLNQLPLCPSFLIWPTAIMSVQLISHMSPIKNTLPVFTASRLLSLVLCVWPGMESCFSGITQILTFFHQISFSWSPVH